MIKIFEDDDTAHLVLEYVIEIGIAGIAGMRTATRARLAQVRKLAESQGRGEIVALATVNHPYTELAFIYDNELYDFYEARQKVVEAYDQQLAEQGLWPLPVDE